MKASREKERATIGQQVNAQSFVNHVAQLAATSLRNFASTWRPLRLIMRYH